MNKDIAGQGPLERPVRPRVWMVRRHDAPNYWIPFLHEPVDALNDLEREVVLLHWPEDIEAERERCAKLCEEVESQAWALWKTTADPIEQGRNIGAQHCADAIRA